MKFLNLSICHSLAIIFYLSHHLPSCKIERKRSKAQKKSFDVVDKNKMNEKHVIIDGMREKTLKNFGAINEQRLRLRSRGRVDVVAARNPQSLYPDNCQFFFIFQMEREKFFLFCHREQKNVMYAL